MSEVKNEREEEKKSSHKLIARLRIFGVLIYGLVDPEQSQTPINEKKKTITIKSFTELLEKKIKIQTSFFFSRTPN